MNIVWILTLAIIAGQLIKLPISNLAVVSLLDITIIFLCLLGLLRLKFRLGKPPLYIKFGLLFVFMAALSLALTPLNLTTREMLISFLYTVRFASFILFVWLISSNGFPMSKNHIQSIVIFSGIGLATLGLIQFTFLPDLKPLTQYGWDPHYFRTVSTFLDPNFAGAYFVLTLLAIIESPLPVKRRSLAMVLVYLALLTSFSRSSYLMFLVSGLTLSFLKKSKQLLLKISVLFIILFLGFQIYTQVVAEPRNIEREKSASFRFNTWQQGLTIFQNSPLLGIGYNSYRYALIEYNLGNEQFISSHGASSNDSSLLFVLATTGIIGLICYLLFLFSLLKLSPIIIGLLVHSFFANSLFYPPILLLAVLSAAIPKK